MELIRQKELEARKKKKEIKRRDQALKKLDQMETQLLIKLNLQAQHHKELTEEYIRSRLQSQLTRDEAGSLLRHNKQRSASREEILSAGGGNGVILNVIHEEDGSALDTKFSSHKKKQKDISTAKV
jgi:hypothetical protein